MHANLRKVRRVDGQRVVDEPIVAVFRLEAGRTTIEAADDLENREQFLEVMQKLFTTPRTFGGAERVGTTTLEHQESLEPGTSEFFRRTVAGFLASRWEVELME